MSVRQSNLIAPLAAFLQAAGTPPAEPFLSIKAFRLADSAILAARDDEIEEMARLITMYRGVILYGESGSGKTSLVNAGVIPRMLELGFWPHRVRVPVGSPGFALEPIQYTDERPDSILPSAFGVGGEDGRFEVAADEFVGAVATAAEQARILLVFDQFEELVTLSQDAAQVSEYQAAIIEALLELLRGGPTGGPNGTKAPIRVKLLFTFREDYLASLAPLFERYPDLVHQGMRLAPPPLESAPDIIRAPFDRFPGHYPQELSRSLAGQIAEMLSTHARGSELPLSILQIVCSRLVDEDDPGAVLEDRKIEGLLEDYTEAALEELPGHLRAAAVEVLGRLVTSTNTRNVVAKNDLVQRPGSDTTDTDPDLAAALTILEHGSGLIRKENRRGIDLYELTSEFLIPWIRRERDELNAERKAEAARVEAQRKAEEKRREQEHKLRLLRIGLAVAVVVAAVMLVLVLVALHQKNKAQHEQRAATDARRQSTATALASGVQHLLAIRPDAALIMALAAYRIYPDSPEVQTNMIAGLEQAELSGARGILHGSLGTVTSVAFDPVSGLLASGSGDGTIRLWNTTRNTQIRVMDGSTAGSGVFSLAFGDRGRRLVSADASGYVRLWDVPGRRELGAPLRVLNQLAVSVAFSPSGDRVAVAGLDGPVKLVAVPGGQRLGAVSDLPGPRSIYARAVAFSPDSRTLVSVGNDRKVRFWDLSAGASPRTVHIPSPLFTASFDPAQPNVVAVAGLNGVIYLVHVGSGPYARLRTGASAVNSLAFSDDGQTIAAGLADDSIRLWRVATRSPLGAPLIGHQGPVTSVAFSPGGNTLASGSTDTTIRLWPIPLGRAYGKLPGQTRLAHIYSVTFGGNHEFAEAGRDGLRVWKVANGVPTGSPIAFIRGSARSVVFQPGSATGALTAGLYDGSLVRLSQAGRAPSAPEYTRGPVYTVAYSPDGRMLAYAGNNRWITVIDIASGRRVRLRTETQVYSLAFGPHNGILASSSDDRTIHLWKIGDGGGQPSGGVLGLLSGDSDAVFNLAFNGAGMLASGSDDGTIRIWDVSTRKEVGDPLLGDRSYVHSVAFSPDGAILASAGYDGTVRLWDVASRSQIGVPFNASSGPVETVAFSPDGLDLIAGSADGSLSDWPVVRMPHTFSELQRMVCRRVGANLGGVEWTNLLGRSVPYQQPCP